MKIAYCELVYQIATMILQIFFLLHYLGMKTLNKIASIQLLKYEAFSFPKCFSNLLNCHITSYISFVFCQENKVAKYIQVIFLRQESVEFLENNLPYHNNIILEKQSLILISFG